MNARHLETRRPRKDRDVTWSRSFRDGLITWTLWRRDYRRAIHTHVVAVSEIDLQTCEPGWLKTRLRRAWHELRDFVDEIDLKETA